MRIYKKILKEIETKDKVRKIIKEELTAYQKFFKATLDKFNVESPDEFDTEEEKKEFFNYIEKN